MADVPGAARLPPPEYRPGAPKALHRRLRQLGGGSLGARGWWRAARRSSASWRLSWGWNPR